MLPEALLVLGSAFNLLLNQDVKFGYDVVVDVHCASEVFQPDDDGEWSGLALSLPLRIRSHREGVVI